MSSWQSVLDIGQAIHISEVPRVNPKNPNRKSTLDYFREDNSKTNPSQNDIQTGKIESPTEQPRQSTQEDIEKNLDIMAIFSLEQFLEALAYHILYFYLIGPFLSIICWVLDKKNQIPYNMGFSFNKCYGVYLQITIWAANITYYVIYSFGEYQRLRRCEFLFVEIFLLFRCVVISSRYGSFSKKKLDIYRSHKLTQEQLSRDFYLGEWLNQTPRIIYNEIQGTITRHQLDKQLFHFNFLVDPLQETAERLIQHNIDLSEYHNDDTEYEPQPHYHSQIKMKDPDDDVPIFFYGFGIIAEFLEIFKRRTKFYAPITQYISFTITLLTICVPIQQRYTEGVLLKWEYDKIILIPFSYLVFMNLMMVIRYNLTGVIDLMRKNFMLSQCATLISAQKKTQLTDVKTLPTINLFCWMNLKAWTILRRVCFEYGYNYFIRSQLLFSVQLVVMLASIFAFTMQVVGVIDIDATFYKIFMLIFIQGFLMSLVVMYLCASINEYFDTFENLLYENRLVISNTQRMQVFYLDMEYVPRNYLVWKGLQMVSKFSDVSNFRLDDYFSNCKKAYDESIESVRVHSNQPFTLLGIKVDKSFFSSFVLGIGSVLSTLLSSVIINMMKR